MEEQIVLSVNPQAEIKLLAVKYISDPSTMAYVKDQVGGESNENSLNNPIMVSSAYVLSIPLNPLPTPLNFCYQNQIVRRLI